MVEMKMEKLLITHRINFIFCGMLNFLLLSNPVISFADDGGRIYVEPSERSSAVPSSIHSIAIPETTHNPGSLSVKS